MRGNSSGPVAIDRSRPRNGSVHGQRKLPPSRPAATAGPGVRTMTPATAARRAAAAKARAPVTGSLRLQADLPRDLAPQIVLRLDEGARLIGGSGPVGEEADDGELMGHVRILQDLVELL